MAFNVFFYSAGTDIVAECEKKALQSSQFNYNLLVRLNISEKHTEIDKYIRNYLKELCTDENVVMVTEMYPEFKPGLSNVKGADICISSHVPRYPISSGTYPTREQLEGDGAYAVISYSHKPDTYIRDGMEYIRYYNEEFLVTGYLSRYSEYLVNNGVMLFLGQKHEAAFRYIAMYLADGFLYLDIFNDNIDNVAETMDRYKKLASDVSEGSFYVKDIWTVTKDDIVNSHTENTSVLNEKQVVYGKLIYMFTVIMLCFMVCFWLSQRKKEFIILRKHGFSRFDLIGSIYRELTTIAIIGAILGEIINLIFIFISEKHFEPLWDVVYFHFLIIIAFSLITVFLSSIISVSGIIFGKNYRL